MKESAVQSQCMMILRSHPKIGYVWRANTGAGSVQNADGRKRFVKFGEKGVADIIGWMSDGRFLAVEVKKPEFYKNGDKKDPSKKLSQHQKDFLENVAKCGGVAIVADDAEELRKDIDSL